MSDNDIVPLRRSFVNQLVSTVKWVRQQQGRGFRPEQGGKVNTGRIYSAVLVTDLAAVEDPMGPPSTGTAVLLFRTSDGSLERMRKQDGTQHTVDVEWRLSFGLSSGTYVHLKRLDGAWTCDVANCTTSESSESWA